MVHFFAMGLTRSRLSGTMFQSCLPSDRNRLIRRPGNRAVQIVFGRRFGEQTGGEQILFRRREPTCLVNCMLK